VRVQVRPSPYRVVNEIATGCVVDVRSYFLFFVEKNFLGLTIMKLTMDYQVPELTEFCYVEASYLDYCVNYSGYQLHSLLALPSRL
jgi:hypothetical protein